MSYERFTDRARKVLMLANQEAQRFNCTYIGTEHVLLGLIKEGSGIAAHALENLGVSIGQVRAETEKLLPPAEDNAPIMMGKLPQTLGTKQVVEYSIEEALNLNHNYVGTEHLLLGLLRVGEGLAKEVLPAMGVTVGALRAEVQRLLGHGTTDDAPNPEWVTVCEPPMTLKPLGACYSYRRRVGDCEEEWGFPGEEAMVNFLRKYRPEVLGPDKPLDGLDTPTVK